MMRVRRVYHNNENAPAEAAAFVDATSFILPPAVLQYSKFSPCHKVRERVGL
jgi:hypothetical protein